ncbi:hypothetical protein D7X32_09245 [Corallococcus carmarthensis]|uniref:Transposase IS4-like domain-containing protein n=1 Tax=Corallococcus carmarthensis TaxID=2316728 RepID=A0A3A8KAR2_9BACT|nr:hypothetical protein D7X32_09245 [Corallococcus carmarthensis]
MLIQDHVYGDVQSGIGVQGFDSAVWKLCFLDRRVGPFHSSQFSINRGCAGGHCNGRHAEDEKEGGFERPLLRCWREMQNCLAVSRMAAPHYHIQSPRPWGLVQGVEVISELPQHVALTRGQQHEYTMAEELLVHAEGAALIADTGYDADRIRANVRKLRMKPVIHSNPSRKRALPLDRTLYRLRYRVECFFHDLKRFRAVATRYDKMATSYLAVLHVASMFLWLR